MFVGREQYFLQTPHVLFTPPSEQWWAKANLLAMKQFRNRKRKAEKIRRPVKYANFELAVASGSYVFDNN